AGLRQLHTRWSVHSELDDDSAHGSTPERDRKNVAGLDSLSHLVGKRARHGTARDKWEDRRRGHPPRLERRTGVGDYAPTATSTKSVPKPRTSPRKIPASTTSLLAKRPQIAISSFTT